MKWKLKKKPELKPTIKPKLALKLKMPSVVKAQPEVDKSKPRPLRLCVRCGGEEFRHTGTCSFCTRRELRPARPGETRPERVFFAIGPGCWGLGALSQDAVANMAKNWPTFIPREGQKYALWDAPRGAYVAKDGMLAWPTKTAEGKAVEPPKLLSSYVTCRPEGGAR